MISEAVGEWKALRVGLVVACGLMVAQVLTGVGYALVHEDPSAYELALTCLQREKSLVVDLGAGDPIARRASGGVLRTTVEGNPVTASFASSSSEARSLSDSYEAASALLPGQLETRGHVVLRFDGPGSPTQRQTLYDCIG